MRAKFLNVNKKILKSNHLRTFITLACYYLFFWYLNYYIVYLMKVDSSSNPWVLTLWTFAFTTLFLAISSCFRPWIRKSIMMFFMLLTMFLGMIDITYHFNYATFPSISALILSHEATEIAGIIVDVMRHANAFNPYLLIPVGLLIIMFDKISWKLNWRAPFILLSLSASLFIGSLLFFDTEGSTGELMYSDLYLLDTLFMREEAFMTFGIYGYHIADIVNYFEQSKFAAGAPTDDIDAYFENKEVDTTSNSATGALEGKNLVMIQVESLSPYAINPTSTPNMNYMKENGIYFDNFYGSTYLGNTSDAEFAALTGMIPNIYDPTVYVNKDNYMPGTLPTLFEENGYETYGSHCNTGHYYNRIPNWEELYGININYFQEQLHINVPGDYYQPDAICAEAFYDKIDTSEPFFAFFVTSTSHELYTYDAKTTDETYADTVNAIPGSEFFTEEMFVYMSTLCEADESIGNFIEGLKEDGVYEDTVFVIYGDHKPPLDYGNYGITKDPVAVNKVPLIIYTPGMTPQVNSTLGAEYDITPTLSNAFNLDPDNTYTEYYYGIDLYSDNDSTVVLPNAEFIHSGTKTDVEVMEEIQIYQKILDTDYFAKLE